MARAILANRTTALRTMALNGFLQGNRHDHRSRLIFTFDKKEKAQHLTEVSYLESLKVILKNSKPKKHITIKTSSKDKKQHIISVNDDNDSED